MGFRRVWNIPIITRCDLVHVLCDEISIFDQLCCHSLMFIYKCFFRSSNLVKFITRYGIMTGRQNSTLGSNFYLCISRFNLNQWAFYNGCIDVSDVIRHHCVTLKRGEAFFYSAISA